MKDLSVGLVRADSTGIDHHEGIIPRGWDAGIGGGHCDAWRLGHLLHREVLTWRDGADTGEGDSHEGGGIEGRQKVGDEV